MNQYSLPDEVEGLTQAQLETLAGFIKSQDEMRTYFDQKALHKIAERIVERIKEVKVTKEWFEDGDHAFSATIITKDDKKYKVEDSTKTPPFQFMDESPKAKKQVIDWMTYKLDYTLFSIIDTCDYDNQEKAILELAELLT
jgi:hypothetical protein